MAGFVVNVFQKGHQLFAKDNVIVRATEPTCVAKLLKGHLANRTDPLFRGSLRCSVLVGLNKGLRQFGNVGLAGLRASIFQKGLGMVMTKVMFLPVAIFINISDMVTDRF